MIRVGIIGCGRITQVRHAPEYAANPTCELVGFFDTIPERVEAMISQYGGKHYGSVELMLADPQIDAVSVCTANSTHAQFTIQALYAGKHVLCEKPMATKSSEAKAMVDASKASGKILMIDQNQRLAPAHRLAKEILDSGRMGRVLSFQTVFAHGGPEAWLRSDNSRDVWFFSEDQAAFGVWGDLGIHKVDLICWLLNDDVIGIHGFKDTLSKHYEDGTPISVEDNAVAILRFRKGTIGTLFTSWSSYGVEDNSTVLYCENGVLQLYRDNVQLREICSDGTHHDYTPGVIQTNENQSCSGVIDLFLSGIQEGFSPIPGENGLRVMQIIESALE